MNPAARQPAATLPSTARRAVAALTLTAILAGCTPTPAHPQPTPPPGSPKPPATLPAEPDNPADAIRAFADRLQTAPADHTTGPVTYLHEQAWLRASTHLDAFDTQTWRRPDGSGRTLERHLPAAANLDHEPTAGDQHRLNRVPARDTHYTWDTLPTPINGPVPTNPTTLAAAIAVNYPPDNTLTTVTGIAEVAAATVPDRAQRATILRLLARIPAITYTPHTRDAAGRPGITIGLTHGPDSRQLIFHPETGELLAHREHTTGGARPGLFTYRLYLTRGHTTTTEQPPAAAPTVPALGSQRVPSPRVLGVAS